MRVKAPAVTQIGQMAGPTRAAVRRDRAGRLLLLACALAAALAAAFDVGTA